MAWRELYHRRTQKHPLRPVRSAKTHNKTLMAFYDTLLKAGKPKMVATIAVARKRLTQINLMLR